jgi:HEPN domain-containing protein
MKPPDQVRRELVGQWLAKAEEDLGLLQHLLSLPGAPFPGAVGFHAQQAAEKFLKAFLVDRQVPFPKTHDIAYLLDLAATVDQALAESLRDAEGLTQLAVEARYPADLVSATPDQARDAALLASRVRDAVLAAVPRTA